ncbi:cytochrome c biogenesis protein CcdA [Candidatus Uhrbacteria bacterium]|nr:cytochrome c biogenesis protein CcdA [Candidatus Uhrbacteria bacterium]
MALFFLAIAAGFLTILAPCILPILPFLLGTSAGASKLRPLMTIVGFVGTFSVVGAALATAGTFLGVSNESLRYVAIALLLLFGFALIFENFYEALTAGFQSTLTRLGQKVSKKSPKHGDVVAGLLIGFSLGLVWTPCAGPILGTILTLAVKTKDFLTTMLLMFAYALGAGVPMLGIAYGSQAIQSRLRRIGKWQPTLNKIFGVLVVLTALAILTGYDVIIQTMIIDYYPVQSLLKL